jgi:small subunit ribosomal protein S4
MGDPKRQRRKFSRPRHPWKSERIAEEKELCSRYGLKNRKEIWIAKSKLGRFRTHTKELLGAGAGSEREKNELIEKLTRLGLLKTKSLDAILAIKVEDLLERRLQTIVHRKGLANTIKQARQLVNHGHVLVGDRIVNIAQYHVSSDDEDKIKLSDRIKVVNIEKEGEEGRKELSVKEAAT